MLSNLVPKPRHLACLLRPIWHLGDNRAMQGDLGAHGRRPWGSRLGFLSILEGFRGRHVDVFGQFWQNNCVFWHACLQVTFFKDFGGLNLDVWGSRIKHLVWKVLQKPAFHICRDYDDFVVIFTWFSMILGPILGPGLKHHDFRWFSGEARG